MKAPRKRAVYTVIVLALGGAALVYPALHTTIGRYLLGICVVRVINDSEAPAKNVRFIYSKDTSTSRRTEEGGDLAAGQSRDYWFSAKTVSGHEISYDFEGSVHRAEMIKTIFGGDVFEIRIVPGGWVKPFNNH